MSSERRVKIRNIGSVDVIVTIGQTDPSHIQIPSGSDPILRPGNVETISLSTNGGCSKMYVWSASKNLIWCGIVPLSNEDVDIPLILNPDARKVTYSGLDIPECPEVRRPLKESFGPILEEEKPDIDFFRIILIVSVVLILYGIGEMIWHRVR